MTGIVEVTEQRTSNAQEVSSHAVTAFTEIASEIDSISRQIDSIHEAAKEQDIGMSQTSIAVNKLGEAAGKSSNLASKVDKISGTLKEQSVMLQGVKNRTNEIVMGDKRKKKLRFDQAEKHLSDLAIEDVVGPDLQSPEASPQTVLDELPDGFNADDDSFTKAS